MDCMSRSSSARDAPEPLAVHDVPDTQSMIAFQMKRFEERLAKIEELCLEEKLAKIEELCHTMQGTKERSSEKLHILNVASQEHDVNINKMQADSQATIDLDLISRANATQIQDLEAILLQRMPTEDLLAQLQTLQKQIKEPDVVEKAKTKYDKYLTTNDAEDKFKVVMDRLEMIAQELDQMRKVQEATTLEVVREESKIEELDDKIMKKTATSMTEAKISGVEDVLKNEYALVGSIWDATIFIGLTALGPSGSICLGFVWMVNIIVQSVFCWVCWMVFTTPYFSKQSIWGLNVWRWNEAHHVDNINSLWPISLGSRICGLDSSIPLSGQQATQWNLISRYSPESFVGQLMCLLCLICFWTSLWSDIKDCCKLLTGVWHCRGKRTEIHFTQGGIQIQSLSLPRTAFVVLTAVLRTVVFAIIGASGTFWLSGTVSLGDLLLNACALQLVITVDELLFQVLAPVRAKAMVESCLPLPISNLNTATGLHLIAPLDMFALIGAIIVSYFLLVSETAEFVKQADTALCGGAKNFAYNIDPLGMVHIHDQMQTASDPGFTEDGFHENYRIKAIQEVINGIPHEDWKYALYEPDLGELKVKNSRHYLQNQFNKRCQDMLVEGAPRNQVLPLRAALQHAVKNKSLDLMWCSSSDLQPICRSLRPQEATATHLARLLCPVSCGCASPTGGTPSTEACPVSCGEKLYKNVSQMNTCKDVDLQTDDSWRQWMEEASHFMTDAMFALLTRQGCETLRYLPDGRQYCEGYKAELGYLKPLVGVCPESCGCRFGAFGFCSKTCVAAPCPGEICNDGGRFSPGDKTDDQGNRCFCDLGYETGDYLDCGYPKCDLTNTNRSHACSCGIHLCLDHAGGCYNSNGEQDLDGTLCTPP